MLEKPTNKDIRNAYELLIDSPAYIEELKQFEKDLVYKFAQNEFNKEYLELTKFTVLNENYPYPDQYKNNHIQYWADTITPPKYNNAKSVIDLINDSKIKIDPKLKTDYKADFSEEQINRLFDYFNPEIIETNFKTFTKVFTGSQKSTADKIIWKPIGRNKHPNIKALLDLFYFIIKFFSIEISDKELFNYINQNFVALNGNNIYPKYSNKSNPPNKTQSELFVEFEKIFKTL